MANDTPTLGDLDGDWLDAAAELQLEQVAVRSAAHMSCRARHGRSSSRM
jgi:hypothetical protein